MALTSAKVAPVSADTNAQDLISQLTLVTVALRKREAQRSQKVLGRSEGSIFSKKTQLHKGRLQC